MVVVINMVYILILNSKYLNKLFTLVYTCNIYNADILLYKKQCYRYLRDLLNYTI